MQHHETSSSNKPRMRRPFPAVRSAIVAVAVSGTAMLAGGADAPPPPFRFTVGAFECVVLYDMTAQYDARSFFINAPEPELRAALAAAGESDAEIDSPYAALLVRTGRHVVLIDTGAGPSPDPAEGHLLASLAACGVSPREVDTVLLTHAHLDHIGGALDAAGRPVFPQARYVMFRHEWDFWMQDAPDLSALQIPEESRQRFVAIAHAKLARLRRQIELIEADTEVRPGIVALLAAGHTPGHMVVRIESGGERLLYVSDLVLSPITLEHPEWHTRYECDVTASQATKRRFLDYAARENLLVYAMHFAFPGLGRVHAVGDSWSWRPETAAQLSPATPEIPQDLSLSP